MRTKDGVEFEEGMPLFEVAGMVLVRHDGWRAYEGVVINRLGNRVGVLDQFYGSEAAAITELIRKFELRLGESREQVKQLRERLRQL